MLDVITDLLSTLEDLREVTDRSVTDEDLGLTAAERELRLQELIQVASSQADDVESEVSSLADDASTAISRAQTEVEDASYSIDRLTGAW